MVRSTLLQFLLIFFDGVWAQNVSSKLPTCFDKKAVFDVICCNYIYNFHGHACTHISKSIHSFAVIFPENERGDFAFFKIKERSLLFHFLKKSRQTNEYFWRYSFYKKNVLSHQNILLI